jgi:charged multivesicular body protein 4A/B
MNLFNKLFGKPKNELVKENDDKAKKALKSLKESIEMLGKKDSFIAKNNIKMKEEAKNELKLGNKKKALYLLKKIKMGETEMENLYGMIQI